jgi:hypothetical protein
VQNQLRSMRLVPEFRFRFGERRVTSRINSEAESNSMQTSHTKIAHSIGKGVNERLETSGREKLPQRLIDLLARLHEAEERDRSLSARKE